MLNNIDGPKKKSWLCPSDRYLTLRSQLNAGWSAKANKSNTSDSQSTLTEAEVSHIKEVLARAEKVNCEEKIRIGRLVDRLERMKRNISGSRLNQCQLCGTNLGVMGTLNYAAYCNDCHKRVCNKNCGLETTDSSGKPIFLCKLCSEAREMWKKSGAWFYRTIPDYVKPNVRHTRSVEPLQLDRIASSASTMTPSSSKDSFRSDHRDLSISQVIHSSCRRVLPVAPIESSGFRSNKPRWAIISGNRQSLDQCRTSSSEEEVEDERSSIYSADQGPMDSTTSPLSSSYGSLSRMSTAKADKAIALPDDHNQGVLYDENETPDNRSYCSDAAESETLSQSCSYASSHLTTECMENNVAKRRPTSFGRYDVTPEERSAKSSSPDLSLNNLKMKPESISESSPENELGLGSLEFSIFYNEDDQMLTINVFKASNLPAKDSNGLSDPYVKAHLLPLMAKNLKATKMRTKTKPKTLNPCWNEQLIYHGISKDDLLKKTLRLMVLDEDRIGSDFLGETRVPLKRMAAGKEKHFNVYLEKQMPVNRCDELNEERGKILFSLNYDSSQQALMVEIIRCAELTGMDSSGYSDPYVKVKLKPETNKYHHFKTEVKKRTLNPEFKRLFCLPVSAEELPKKTLDIQVWDRDVGKQDDFIGSVELNISAKGPRLKHWSECLRNPNKAVKRWHKLTS